MKISKVKKKLCNYFKLFGFIAVVFILPSCAFAPWDKSAVVGKTPEEKVASAVKLSSKDNAGTIARKDLLVTKDLQVSKMMLVADEAKSKGQYNDADLLYKRVLKILPDDPNAIIGQAKVERYLALDKIVDEAQNLQKQNKSQEAKDILRDVFLEYPQHSKALALKKEIDTDAAPTKNTPPKLKSNLDRPVTLELRDANIKVVFEALSRATGINFILDKDIKPDTKATIFIKKAAIEDAIQMVLSSNGLQKKDLSENTAVVFPSTQAKLKDYQDLMIRSFYLTNTSAKQVSALLKSMLKTKDIFVDDRLNMIVMRDTPEVIRIAEKLVAANDLADPEVMLEIEVLEVSRNRLQELGINYPSQLSVLNPVALTPTASASLTLEALKGINSSRIGVSPNPAINFRKTTDDVNVLSNPRIRVKNNEKAKILVGDKVPIITTTAVAQVGVSDNVQYVDVGLKLDVEPRISLDDFVNIKVGLEVSSLGARTITRNGTEVFTIGTRNANTVLRLKNGETQILAGLILDDERKNASKLPGLGDIPLLGRLFSNQTDTKNKTEIVLAITPRIITNISQPQAEISEYWSGTESTISDKPQLALPAGANDVPLTIQDRMREQMRLRQSQQAEQPAEQQAEQPAPAVEPVPPTVPASTEPIKPAAAEEVQAPPIFDPANPPLAP